MGSGGILAVDQDVDPFSIASGSNRTFFPVKGWDRLAQPVKRAIIKFLPGREHRERVIPLYHFDDGAFKSDLYCRRIQDRDGPPWHLPRNVGADFLRQLTAEKLVEKKNARGAIETVWQQIHRDNHYGDCEKMQLVHGYLLASQLKEKAQADTSEEEKPDPGAAYAAHRRNPLFERLGINPGGRGRGWNL